MKFLVALAAFLLVLGLNVKAVAAGGGGHDAHAKGDGKNPDWSHTRHKQVGAIFPEKQTDQTKSVIPAKVKLTSPKFLEKVSGETVKLEWTASEGAKTYHVQVSRDAGFNNRSMYVAEDKMVSGTSFEVKGLEAGVKYFWRVAAQNSDQEVMQTKSLFTFSEFEVK